MPGEKRTSVQGEKCLTYLDDVLISEAPVGDTGIERQYHSNGKLAAEIPLKHGKTHGMVRTWHDNGALATEREDVFGDTFGVSRQWGREGLLEMEMHYVLPHAVRGCNFYDQGRRRCAFLWNGKPVSKARWIERVLATGISRAKLETRLAC